MKLEIVYAPPPQEIYEACDKRFKIRGRRGVMYCVGAKLFNPDHVFVDPLLMAHEQVHCDRQLASGDIVSWWLQYLDDKEFRFDEELLAHREEWRLIKETVPSRQQRRKSLAFITGRLSGSLYGNLVTREQAKRLITGGRE